MGKIAYDYSYKWPLAGSSFDRTINTKVKGLNPAATGRG
jgi:hypothetical protein